MFLLVGSAFVGFGARDGWFTRNPAGSSVAASAGNSSSTNSNNTSTSNTDLGAVADRVDNAIVNITTQTPLGEAAGTGMLISSKGLVLTNHHVISQALQIQVEVGGNGKTYSAHVVGYSIADDVAVVQIEGVSGLPTIDTDQNVMPNEQVLVMGNALGRGGAPTVSAGRVVALDQQITATDETGANAETLKGMIQLAASVQPGQSGGAVVDADGQIVGMTTAASVSGGYRFGFQQGSNDAFAIPIGRAVAAAESIENGTSNSSIHVGARGILGIEVAGNAGRSSDGVTVNGVTSGGPADKAGISAGSTIVAIGDTTVQSPTDITTAMNLYSPNDRIKVTWDDTSGSRHTATVQLDKGPPA
ncbi:MAG: S1C family serine protease [Acidimicrobiia bacterium]